MKYLVLMRAGRYVYAPTGKLFLSKKPVSVKEDEVAEELLEVVDYYGLPMFEELSEADYKRAKEREAMKARAKEEEASEEYETRSVKIRRKPANKPKTPSRTEETMSGAVDV